MPAGDEVTAPPAGMAPPALDAPAPVTVVRVVRVSIARPNSAVTEAAPLIVTVHAPVPVQPLLQPRNSDPASGDADRLTTVPDANPWLQVAPQEMPTGVEVTAPPPSPVFATVSVWLTVTVANVAVTD